jgi:hypothetical protein
MAEVEAPPTFGSELKVSTTAENVDVNADVNGQNFASGVDTNAWCTRVASVAG